MSRLSTNEEIIAAVGHAIRTGEPLEVALDNGEVYKLSGLKLKSIDLDIPHPLDNDGKMEATFTYEHVQPSK